MDSTKHPDEAEAGRRFRPDIEGLRAVAIVAVLLCHAGVPFLAGGYVGVDVFFVISGFLITRLLLGELDRSGTISLRGFYARRAKRLLPLSAVLLAAVGVLSMILLSPLRDTEVAGDIIASALYVANWHFAAQSVDYFAQGLEPSPVLHLWSLAIEEQFYLVWPGLMLVDDLVLAPPRALGAAGALGGAGADPRRLADLRRRPHRRQTGLRLLLHLRPRLGAGARRRGRPGRDGAACRASARSRSAGPGWRRSSTPASPSPAKPRSRGRRRWSRRSAPRR